MRTRASIAALLVWAAACGAAPVQRQTPTCAQALTEWCTKHLAETPAACFQRATAACSGQRLDFPSCVRRTADYCRDRTILSPARCLDEASRSCRQPPRRVRAR